MRWHGKELDTLGDYLLAIQQVETKEEARMFLELYFAENEYARENIGYLAGYFTPERKQQIFELFDTSHPFFGVLEPTAEQVYSVSKLTMDRMQKKQKEMEQLGKGQPEAVDQRMPKRLIEP